MDDQKLKMRELDLKERELAIREREVAARESTAKNQADAITLATEAFGVLKKQFEANEERARRYDERGFDLGGIAPSLDDEPETDEPEADGPNPA